MQIPYIIVQIIHRDLKSSNVFLDMCAEPDDRWSLMASENR